MDLAANGLTDRSLLKGEAQKFQKIRQPDPSRLTVSLSTLILNNVKITNYNSLVRW
jgi:hypothetical protein